MLNKDALGEDELGDKYAELHQVVLIQHRFGWFTLKPLACGCTRKYSERLNFICPSASLVSRVCKIYRYCSSIYCIQPTLGLYAAQATKRQY